MKRTSRASLPESIALHHRVDFVRCTHCDTPKEHEDWLKLSTTLILDTVYGKHDCVAVVSECDICFKKSWVHVSLDSFDVYFDDIDPNWVKLAAIEHGKRRLSAIRDWSKSLCLNCKHVERVSCTTSTYRHCIAGMGPAQTECDKFKGL